MAKAKKKTNKPFNLFFHEDLELKNNLINAAREMRKKQSVAEQFASALIYASTAEYLGEHFLENCRHLAYNATVKWYGGIVAIDERLRGENKNLGAIIHHLEKYEFPLKKEILGSLKDICESRNNLFHNLAKVKKEEFSVLEKDVEIIQNSSEELLTNVNIVYASLGKIILPQPPVLSPEVPPQGQGQETPEK